MTVILAIDAAWTATEPSGGALVGAAGFPIATAAPDDVRGPRLVEVYPHPALLTLLGRPYRVPYKVSKASRYWPDATPAERRASLLGELTAISGALAQALGPHGVT